MSLKQERFGFIAPRSSYYGQPKSENFIFDAKLQEFAQQVSIVSSLETGGKLSPQESYKKIKLLWKQLKRTKKQLHLDEDSTAAPSSDSHEQI